MHVRSECRRSPVRAAAFFCKRERDHMAETHSAHEAPSGVRIVIDTCADLTPEVAASLDVDILGFPYILDGEEHTDDIWTSITPKEFYDKLRAGSSASTSAVSLGRYLEFFEQCAQEGTPTVYLCFTSALSSSYGTACTAADRVRASYPDFELHVVDNALPCAAASCLRWRPSVSARPASTRRSWLLGPTRRRPTSHGYFTLDSLDALSAGGRIPPAAAQLSSKLDIKPKLSFPTYPAPCPSSASTAVGRRP